MTESESIFSNPHDIPVQTPVKNLQKYPKQKNLAATKQATSPGSPTTSSPDPQGSPSTPTLAETIPTPIP